MAVELSFLPAGPPAELQSQGVLEDVAAARLSLPFRLFYGIRSFLPLAARQALQRIRGAKQDLAEDWFLPQELSQRLGQHDPWMAEGLWPGDASYAFVLTHDVETKEGMQRIAALADVEESLGLRSSWNLVPHKYAIDRGIVRDLVDRGFEIGVHGYNHDGKLFTSRRVFEQRVPAINRAIEDFGAVGFRAPMVHRNLAWLQKLNIEYDASCFDVDPLQAMPGGVQTIWPFVCGKFVELPYTLPQDHTLFVALGETTDRIWRRKLQWLQERGGMALMLTHPDYLMSERELNLYRGFLEHVCEVGGYAHLLPREAASWTRQAVDAGLASVA